MDDNVIVSFEKIYGSYDERPTKKLLDNQKSNSICRTLYNCLLNYCCFFLYD
jgi:hypothetical protein